MSVKTCTVISLIFLIQALLTSLASSYPLALKDYLDIQEQLEQKEKKQDSNWSNLATDVNPSPEKRLGCSAFPCMYTHMAAKAGRASLYRTLAKYIDECVMDPNCVPVKRMNIHKGKGTVLRKGRIRGLSPLRKSY